MAILSFIQLKRRNLRVTLITLLSLLSPHIYADTRWCAQAEEENNLKALELMAARELLDEYAAQISDAQRARTQTLTAAWQQLSPELQRTRRYGHVCIFSIALYM